MEEYPDRITLKDDGMYHWRYQLSKEQAREHWITMIWICTIVTTVVAVIMTMLIGLKEVWPYLLLLYGMLVGLPALIGYLTLGWDSRSYTMDEECIRHKHATKGGDAFIFYKKVKEAYVEKNAFTIKEGITTYSGLRNLDFSTLKSKGVKAYIVEREYAWTGDPYTTILDDFEYLSKL